MILGLLFPGRSRPEGRRVNAWLLLPVIFARRFSVEE
jgi:hypothetical protein